MNQSRLISQFTSPATSILLSVAVGFGLTGCNSDDDSTSTGGGGNPGGTAGVASYFPSMSTNGVDSTVEIRTGAAPAGSAAGAVLAYGGGSTVAQGSTGQGRLTSTDAFDALVVSLDGVDGYYEIALDQAQTTVDLLLSLDTEAPAGAIDCLFQGRRMGDSDFGEAVTIPLEILDVGSGELQVNLTWNTDADLDINVFEPSGARIWYAETTSASGGQLDLDANVNCGSVSVENIFWSQVPPNGEYMVAVDNFQACTEVTSDYIITVTLPGEAPMVFTGSIAEADSLVDVATFMVGAPQ